MFTKKIKKFILKVLDTNNADCNLNIQINADEPEVQTGLTNLTTWEGEHVNKIVCDIIGDNSSIETETISSNEYGYNLNNLNYCP